MQNPVGSRKPSAPAHVQSDDPISTRTHQSRLGRFRVSVNRIKTRLISRIKHNPVTQSIKRLQDRCITLLKFSRLVFRCVSEKIMEHPILYVLGAPILPFVMPYVFGRAVESASKLSRQREYGTVGSDEPLDENEKWDLHPDARKLIEKGLSCESEDSLYAVTTAREISQKAEPTEQFGHFPEDLTDRMTMIGENEEGTKALYQNILDQDDQTKKQRK